MGRIDVQRLNVPADFAAIFEQHNDKPAAGEETAVAPAISAVASDTCNKCGSRMSAVEAKMGRCLTCGTVFSGQNMTVGL